MKRKGKKKKRETTHEKLKEISLLKKKNNKACHVKQRKGFVFMGYHGSGWRQSQIYKPKVFSSSHQQPLDHNDCTRTCNKLTWGE